MAFGHRYPRRAFRFRPSRLSGAPKALRPSEPPGGVRTGRSFLVLVPLRRGRFDPGKIGAGLGSGGNPALLPGRLRPFRRGRFIPGSYGHFVAWWDIGLRQRLRFFGHEDIRLRNDALFFNGNTKNDGGVPLSVTLGYWVLAKLRIPSGREPRLSKTQQVGGPFWRRRPFLGILPCGLEYIFLIDFLLLSVYVGLSTAKPKCCIFRRAPDCGKVR